MDGWVTIGTKLDDSGIDKGISKVEKDLQVAQKEADRLHNRLSNLRNELKSMPRWKLDSPDAKRLEEQISKTEIALDKAGNKTDELMIKMDALNSKRFDSIKGSINGAGKSINNIIKKVGKWAIAIFGIRTAYLGIRKIIDMVSQGNEQIQTNLKYIQWAVAQAFKPIVEWIIKGVYNLLNLLNLVLQRLFKFNIFANSSAKAFQEANKSAKELKKTTAGFDEMNVVGNSNMNSNLLPSVDLSQMQGETPKWLEWMLDNGDIIKGILFGIGAGLLAVKLGFSGLKSLGIGILIAGIIVLIENLLKYLKDPSWENFGGVIKGIGIILLGLGIIIGNIPLIIAGVLTIIAGLIIQHWDKIKVFLEKVWNWIDDKLKWIEKKFGLVGQMMTDPFRIAIDTIKNLFYGLFKGIKDILDGIIKIFKGDFKGGLISIGKGILNILISLINTFINGLNIMISPIRALIVGIGKVIGKNFTMQNIKIPTIKYLKTGGIVNLPNKGVPVGTARAGESGIEGVIPLTDSQAMETLGSAIGRYITVNLNNITNLDGRKINQQLKKIDSSADFILNR